MIKAVFFVVFLFIFIFGCLGSSLLRTDFLQLWREGTALHCGARASHCSGFSCCTARALGTWASVAVAQRLSSCGSRALERRLSSCGTLAQLLRGLWDLPRPGLEPVSPALTGRFLTTAPPGKSQSCVLGQLICRLMQNGLESDKMADNLSRGVKSPLSWVRGFFGCAVGRGRPNSRGLPSSVSICIGFLHWVTSCHKRSS